ncbi:MULTISPECIES: PleD family two-component system response regulator [unclassified Roseitalea]|uniref:PleD family two-component system response regulator n=1 Tax=unclassified Roseitalea TaxID=2639107 RepID=UPI00273DA97F|nr:MULTISPECIES: PleD family two-component system response regulator [unclassified Roseitalea]
MTARILVVDDNQLNLDLLDRRLTMEYYDVTTALNGERALAILADEPIDIVLLDIMMPGIDGFEVCRRIKSDPATLDIPVVMVTALDQMADRVRGLECGADDFLTKPVNETQLLARVKSLVRLKMLTDELRLRAHTTRDIAIEELLGRQPADAAQRAEVLLVDERVSVFEKFAAILRGKARIEHVRNPQEGVLAAAEGRFDCLVMSADFADFDPLRLVSQIRSLDRTRYLPILLVSDTENDALISRALDLGVNDYVVRPVDPNEFTARLRTQVRRKHYYDGLRSNVAESIELAVTDGLTGLHNRRYLDTHLETLVDRAHRRERALSLLITDIDHFKAVNDTHGHDGGDEVLREFARRLRAQVRGMDLVCRYGGEEFVIVMPDTPAVLAAEIGERLRAGVEERLFPLGRAGQIPVTASVGVATLAEGSGEDAAALLKKADTALYEAKNAGRNRVIARAA